MTTYRAQFLGAVPNGWERDDVLARVVSIVSSIHDVDAASVSFLDVHQQTAAVVVRFRADLDAEARDIVTSVIRDLPGSYDALLDRRDRKYTRITL